MRETDAYAAFLDAKVHLGGDYGFAPSRVPDYFYDHQKYLFDWSVRKGRAAIYADCGLGKTLLELCWADEVVRRENRSVLLLTPLSVSSQTIAEGAKFGVGAVRSRRGELPSSPSIVVTNYEQLHRFNWQDFVGVVCDESSCIKSFDAARTAEITDFMRKLPYRLLCTATAAPNDYIELGTSSEALGEMGYMDMLSRFFKNDQNSNHPNRLWSGNGKWRFRGHAERDFWRWVCSWARACRRPSDLGFDDSAFVLPPMETVEHVVPARLPRPGRLFDTPAETLEEQREERRRTLPERCEKAAELIVARGESAVAWCHLNPEGDRLERLIPGSVQIKGGDPDERREEILSAFANGEVRVLISKPSIAAHGLNWQHCAHQTYFPSHSFEQFYQGTRRSWRFGQKRPVRVDVVTTEGETGVLANLLRKSRQAEEMFPRLVELMNDELSIRRSDPFKKTTEVPPWL